MKLTDLRLTFAGALLTAAVSIAGCATSSSSSSSSSASDSSEDFVIPASKRGALTSGTPASGPEKLPSVEARANSRGPSLDRAGCDPTGKATVVTSKGADGQINRWRYYAMVRRGGASVKVLKCEAADTNGDGYVDARHFYDDRGQLTLEQRDLDFDGRAEVVADYSQFSYGNLKHARDLN
jgi:hypothetical protein